MFVHQISPVLVHLGRLEIRYYGLFYALGFFLSYVMIRSRNRKEKLLSEEDFESFFLWLMVSVVVGARIVYVLVYNLRFYLQHPWEVFAVWHGGLSFHGGLLGGLLVAYVFCRKKKVSLLRFADVCVVPLAFALFLGRIGNFINGELYGRITSLPWAVKFPNVEGFRHPSQLYEAVKNLLIFGVLLQFRKKRRRPGFLFAVFLVMYGVLRFLIEFVREPERHVGFLTMGQFLSLFVIAAGVYLFTTLKVSPP